MAPTWSFATFLCEPLPAEQIPKTILRLILEAMQIAIQFLGVGGTLERHAGFAVIT